MELNDFLFHIPFRWEQGDLWVNFLPDVQGGASSWAGVETFTYRPSALGWGPYQAAVGTAVAVGGRRWSLLFLGQCHLPPAQGHCPWTTLPVRTAMRSWGLFPGAFRVIVDLTSPMLLDPQNAEHGR